jgi:hypothetical protein
MEREEAPGTGDSGLGLVTFNLLLVIGSCLRAFFMTSTSFHNAVRSRLLSELLFEKYDLLINSSLEVRFQCFSLFRIEISLHHEVRVDVLNCVFQ